MKIVSICKTRVRTPKCDMTIIKFMDQYIITVLNNQPYPCHIFIGEFTYNNGSMTSIYTGRSSGESITGSTATILGQQFLYHDFCSACYINIITNN